LFERLELSSDFGPPLSGALRFLWLL